MTQMRIIKKKKLGSYRVGSHEIQTRSDRMRTSAPESWHRLRLRSAMAATRSLQRCRHLLCRPSFSLLRPSYSSFRFFSDAIAPHSTPPPLPTPPPIPSPEPNSGNGDYGTVCSSLNEAEVAKFAAISETWFSLSLPLSHGLNVSVFRAIIW